MTIQRYLLDKKIMPNCKGFDFLAETINLLKSNKEYKGRIVELYKEVAKVFNGTSGQVQQAMRTALKRSNIKINLSAFISLAVVEINEENQKKE